MPGEPDDEGYEDIYEPLEDLWIWMRNVGVRDVPEVDVIYNEAILLAEAMQKDILDYYRGAMILQQLVTDGTSEQHMENYTSARGQLSRKMFRQCRLYRQNAPRSFGFPTTACLRHRTMPLWRACVRWLRNYQTRAEA